tara:strand:- start:2772 stop:2966 length:195 start_codon:yes stop_codon:yes gene_type:complete
MSGHKRIVTYRHLVQASTEVEIEPEQIKKLISEFVNLHHPLDEGLRKTGVEVVNKLLDSRINRP